MSSFKIAFLADIHYFSPSLGTSGRAYELRSGSDQKCLAESGAVFDAASELLSKSDVDAVCIAGDLTNNGEKQGHREIFEKLKKLNEKKRVYVITSTHDWGSDGKARRYEGSSVFRDVEILPPPEVNELYSFFGSGELLAEFTTSRGFVSRVFALSDTLRLIAVNDDGDGAGGASGYSPEHLQWMISQIRKAKEAGCQVIAMEHHLLLTNIGRLVNKTQTIADNEETAAALADAGLRLMFTGHSHMQRTTEFISPNGNKITQVNLGSLCGYPAPITYVTVTDSKAALDVEFLEHFTYEGKHYGADFFREHTLAVLYNLIRAAKTDRTDLKERLAADGIRPKKLDTFYPLIRRAAAGAETLTAGKALKLLNVLSIGKAADKHAIKAIRDDRLLNHIADVFLNVFDGSYTAGRQKEEVRQITTSLASLPSRAIRALPVRPRGAENLLGTTDQISAIAKELMYPSAPDNMHHEVDL